jgi:hypothetical protein
LSTLVFMHSNEASIHEAPTVIPPALGTEPTLEQLSEAMRERYEAMTIGQLEAESRERYARELEAEERAAKRELVAIGALTFHAGTVCSECDGEGRVDSGWDHHGRPAMVRCSCAVESCGEVYARGQVCDGPDDDGCTIGIYPERLGNGAFALPNGRKCCSGCAAIAVGYRGVDDDIDLGILTALELQERAS